MPSCPLVIGHSEEFFSLNTWMTSKQYEIRMVLGVIYVQFQPFYPIAFFGYLK